MSVYVLVHGAFHGGWCWGRVAPYLEAAGHIVVAETMPGLGLDEKNAEKVTLGDHVDFVAGLIEGRGLDKVILVGHSYSGLVIAGAAARVGERVSALVYLDAYVPRDGESLADIKGKGWIESVRERIGNKDDAVLLEAPSSRNFDVLNEDDIAWVDARLSPHPLKTFTEPVKFDNPLPERLRLVYILCAEQEDSFEDHAGCLRNNEGWQFYEMAAGHDCMITHPKELADILLSLA